MGAEAAELPFVARASFGCRLDERSACAGVWLGCGVAVGFGVHVGLDELFG
jgi:hypothetical protein